MCPFLVPNQINIIFVKNIYKMEQHVDRYIPTKSYWVTHYKTSSSTVVLHSHGNVFAYPFSTRNLAL